MRFEIDCLYAVPTVQMRNSALDTDNPADLSTIDGLNGWARLVELYKEECTDATEWARAFEQCAEGLYEAERLAYRPKSSDPVPPALTDSGAACQAVGAFLHGLFTAP